jgi:streptogramin lyase
VVGRSGGRRSAQDLAIRPAKLFISWVALAGATYFYGDRGSVAYARISLNKGVRLLPLHAHLLSCGATRNMIGKFDLLRKTFGGVAPARPWKANFKFALVFAISMLLGASILTACGTPIAPVIVTRQELQLKTPAAGTAPTPVAVVATYTLPSANTPNGFLAIASGADLNIWVSEYDGNAIARVTPTGTITEFPIPTAGAGPTEIAPGPDGNLWFCELATNSIGRITTSGVVTEFPLPVGLFPPTVADPGPRGIVAGPDGNIWFGHNAANVIGVISPSGSIVATHAIPTAFSGPVRIANGPDGNMWFVELFANKIGRVNTLTGHIDEFNVPTANSGPAGIHAGADGNMWFTERTASQVARITTSGSIDEFGTPFPTERPQNITSTPDGSLWFAESFKPGLARINPSTLTIVEYALPNSFTRGITAGQGPATVWLTDEAGDSVHELSTSCCARTALHLVNARQ